MSLTFKRTARKKIPTRLARKIPSTCSEGKILRVRKSPTRRCRQRIPVIIIPSRGIVLLTGNDSYNGPNKIIIIPSYELVPLTGNNKI